MHPGWLVGSTLTLLAGCGRIDFDPLARSGQRYPVTITNPVATSIPAATPVPAGYAIRIGLATTAVATDLPDLRVLADDDEPLDPGLDLVLDPATAGEDRAVWFAVQAAIEPGASVRYWLYAGVPDAPAAPADPTRVFALYDAFAPTGLDTRWAVNGAPRAGNGLVLDPGDNAVTTTPDVDGVVPLSVFEARMTTTDGAAPGNYYWIGFQHTGDFGTGGPFINWVGEGSVVHPWVQTSIDERCLDRAQTDVAHTYRIERRATTVRYFLDGEQVCEVAVTDRTDYAIQLRNQSSANGTSIAIDWIRTRPLVDPEPIVEIGAAEALP